MSAFVAISMLLTFWALELMVLAVLMTRFERGRKRQARASRQRADAPLRDAASSPR